MPFSPDILLRDGLKLQTIAMQLRCEAHDVVILPDVRIEHSAGNYKGQTKIRIYILDEQRVPSSISLHSGATSLPQLTFAVRLRTALTRTRRTVDSRAL